MTELQCGAFMAAAAARTEEFKPGLSPLWKLAVKHFPHVHYDEMIAQRTRGGINSENASPAETPYPSTAVSNADDLDSIPDTQVPQSAAVVPNYASPPEKCVASLRSTPESAVGDISILITDSAISWGRAPGNTRSHPVKSERKVPKFGFKILIWKEGFDTARLPRPWTGTWPSADDFHFYISTKATRGIHVNGTQLPSNDARNPTGPSKYWLRLFHGDSIVVWRDDGGEKTELVFHCTWGGSSKARPSLPTSTSPALSFVPEAVARSLDEVSAKFEKKRRSQAEYDRKLDAVERDMAQRTLLVERERERSRIFELKLQEARRTMAMRSSQKTSSLHNFKLVVPSRPTEAVSLPVHPVPLASPELGTRLSQSGTT